ncbi:MAG: hypothetical protein ACLTBK_06870 [Blautia wexlerae]
MAIISTGLIRKPKDAARYMKSMLDEKNTSPAQFVDQYEQMEEKFIRGKYGCVFMYIECSGYIS